MLGLIDAFKDRSRATILFLCVVIIWGYITYLSIPKESTPDVKIPIIYTFITHEGISPEDAQRLLLRPMENALRSIEGIKEMTSYANEGSASIIMEFDAGFDSDKALRDVRAKVDDTESDLPTESEKPTIHEINLSLFPVLNVVLTGDVPERTLVKHARDLRNKVEAIQGILEVKIAGDREDALEIIVEPRFLEGYGLSIQAVKQIIDSNNKLVAAGSIRSETGEYSIKVPSLITNLEDFLNFPIKVNDDAVVRVRDVATIRKTFKEPNDIARVNGKPSIVLQVSKRTGENIIDTVAKVKQVVEKERLHWPEKLQIIYSQDQSDQIIDMVSDLENNIIFGMLLVMIVVLLTVGPRSAFLIALSIPTSFLAGILILGLSGLTLNIVVLFSLILTVGMIVDDAIVVSEYADRKMVEGMEPNEAFVNAAKRMFWPVVTSTLVKLLVFMPLLVWPGVVGQFMVYMPITVIVVLSSSLLYALLFQPSIGPLVGKVDKSDKQMIENMRAADEGDLKDAKGFTKAYMKLLDKVLSKPKTFVLSIFGVLIGVYVFFFAFGTGVEFFPKIEPDSARLVIQSPGNLSLAERDKIMKQVEDKILDMDDEIKVFFSKAGRFDNDAQTPEDTIGIVFVEFVDWQERRKSRVILKEVRDRIASIDGIVVEMSENRPGPPPEKPIQIDITSRDYQLAPPIADMMHKAMHRIGGYKDVEDSRPTTSIEWRIITDRVLAARYGIDVGTIGNTVRLVSNGFKISSYRPYDADDEVDILLRFPERYRSISTLDQVRIVTLDGSVVPISNFVKKEAGPKVSKIKRVNRDRVITIKADVEEGELVDTKVKQLQAWIKDANLDPRVNIQFKGEDEEQQEAADFLSGAFLLALILMFMTMLVQFNNIYHTIIIMSAVFLSTVGVLIGLLMAWQPFGIVMCGVGVIALGGIVLNNNILFIDTYQRLRKDGMELREAILRSGMQRLRPILLTAFTAVLGLLPMVLGLTINFIDREITYDAPSSQWWRQLSTSIAGGLSFATILTLFFTPCLLMIGKRFDRYKNPSD